MKYTQGKYLITEKTAIAKNIYSFVNNINTPEELEKYVTSNFTHHHNNKDILDLITYTGTSSEIDLIIIDIINKQLDLYYSRENPRIQ